MVGWYTNAKNVPTAMIANRSDNQCAPLAMRKIVKAKVAVPSIKSSFVTEACLVSVDGQTIKIMNLT